MYVCIGWLQYFVWLEKIFICETPGLRKDHHVYDNIWNNRLVITLLKSSENMQHFSTLHVRI
jgi:hypothetical protein